MKITSLVKKNNRIQVFIDEEYSFSCTENFVIDNRLYKDLEVTSEEIEGLRTSAQYSIVEFKLFEYASRGVYSEYELKIKTIRYCSKRFDFSPEDAFFKKAFEKLNRLRIYNSREAIRILTQKYISNSKGKSFIFSKLLSKRFEKSEIEEALEVLDEDNMDIKLKQLLEKKHENLFNSDKLNSFEIKQKLYKFGISRGYSYSKVKIATEEIIKKV